MLNIPDYMLDNQVAICSNTPVENNNNNQPKEKTMKNLLPLMTGRQIKSLMIVNSVTIRSLSQTMQITQVRIREVRKEGLTCRFTMRDWIEAITGTDPGSI